MSQGETEQGLAMDLGAELRAAETHLPLARLFTAATLIGLGQATSVVLDSVAGPQDALHEFLYGAIDVLAKATLLLLALVTAAKGFTLVCTQAGGVRSASTEVITTRHTRQRWLS
jgi:hypothetical protein